MVHPTKMMPKFERERAPPLREKSKRIMSRKIAERPTSVPLTTADPERKAARKQPQEQQQATPTKQSSARKRRCDYEPDGANGHHTTFIRKCMFGKDYKNAKAGIGLPPYINAKAAQGRLYHSVTNIPLNVEKFNEGYNSDTGDNGIEALWCLRMWEDRLGEIVDMLPIEKLFAVMWNQFIRTNYVALSDRDVYDAYMRFIDLFGCEVKRMKMEMVFVKQLTRSYELGTVDADGYLEILAAFGNIDMKHVVRGVPHTDFEWPHRILLDSLPQFRKKQYNGVSEGGGGQIPPALKRWLDEEHRKVAELERHVNPTFKNGMANLELWLTELADKEAEWSANLYFDKAT